MSTALFKERVVHCVPAAILTTSSDAESLFGTYSTIPFKLLRDPLKVMVKLINSSSHQVADVSSDQRYCLGEYLGSIGLPLCYTVVAILRKDWAASQDDTRG